MLIVTNLFPPNVVGGYEIAAERTALALVDLGWEVIVLTSSSSLPVSSLRNHAGVDVKYWLGYTDPHNLGIAAHRAKSDLEVGALLDDFSPTHVYFWNISGIDISSIETWLARSRKVDRWWHLMDHKRAVFGNRMPEASRNSRFTFCSQFLRRQYGVSHVMRRSPIIYPPIPSEMQSDAYVESLKLEPQRDYRKQFWGVFIGQYAKHKGVPGILGAARKLEAQLPHAMIDLYTPGVHVSRLQMEVPSNIQIIADCPSADIYRRLPTYDFGLFPTDWDEPFGMALAELRGAGLPTVATQRGGAREIASVGQVPIESASPFDVLQGIHELYRSGVGTSVTQRLEIRSAVVEQLGSGAFQERLTQVFA